MKLLEVLNSNTNAKELAQILKTKCSKFLKESQGLPLFRGLKSKENPLYSKITERKSNMARNKNLFNGFNQGMKKDGFKAHRTNSILCTGYDFDAEIYGTVYRVFIEGNYNISWSTLIRDYFLYYDEKMMKNPLKATIEDGLEYWEKTKHTFKTKNLHDAIKSNHEILINGKGYYGVIYNSELDNELVNYLN